MRGCRTFPRRRSSGVQAFVVFGRDTPNGCTADERLGELAAPMIPAIFCQKLGAQRIAKRVSSAASEMVNFSPA